MIHRSTHLIHTPDLQKQVGGSLLLIHHTYSPPLTCSDPLIHVDPLRGPFGWIGPPGAAR